METSSISTKAGPIEASSLAPAFVKSDLATGLAKDVQAFRARKRRETRELVSQVPAMVEAELVSVYLFSTYIPNCLESIDCLESIYKERAAIRLAGWLRALWGRFPNEHERVRRSL